MGEAQSVIETPQSRFRVRFTRARGFAALFERPDNTYQWSGYGTLRVEPSGVEFEATRRSAIGLGHTEARFVPGREISNVFREADGVRVEFREGSHQTYLNFWADDSAAAASIVEQLPTARTVEVEDARHASSKPPRAFRVGLGAPIVLALGVVLVGAWFGVRWITRDGAAASVGQARHAALPALAPAANQPAPLSPEEMKALQRDVARFAERNAALEAQFASAFQALQGGALSQENFADGLERWLIPQWVSTERELRAATFAPGSRREALRTLEIVAPSNWRSGLEAYATGLRQHDAGRVNRAFVYIGAAEEAGRDVQQFREPQ